MCRVLRVTTLFKSSNPFSLIILQPSDIIINSYTRFENRKDWKPVKRLRLLMTSYCIRSSCILIHTFSDFVQFVKYVPKRENSLSEISNAYRLKVKIFHFMLPLVLFIRKWQVSILGIFITIQISGKNSADFLLSAISSSTIEMFCCNKYLKLKHERWKSDKYEVQ